MPLFLENILKKAAAKKGLKGKRAARYTFGAIQKMGAISGNKVTAKGEAMQAKHKSDLRAKVRATFKRKA